MINHTDAARLREELVLLSESFKGHLAEMMDVVQSCQEVIGGSTEWTERSSAALQKLAAIAHRLGGSAGNFGYPSISQAALPLNSLLSGIRRSHTAPTPEQRNQITTFVRALVKTWETSEVEPISLFEEDILEPETNNPRLVYLVEKDPRLADFIVQQLAQFDYAVKILNGTAEIEVAVSKTRPAAIITNFLLPEGDWNPERMGELTKDIPIIFLTNRADISARLTAVRAGCAAYLVKPMGIHDLVDSLDRLTQGTSNKSANKPYRILIVDDDRYLAESYALTLKLAGMEASVLTEPLKILDVIADYLPDLILMDIYMPECNGIDLAQVVRQHRAYLSIPIVFLSVENNLDRQLAARRLGGDDFLMKPIEPNHLAGAVLSRAERARDLRTVMESDSLTGLLNHVIIKERLAVEVKRAHRQGTPLTFALIDLDHFKAINDRYGHLAGDRVIKALASLLTRRLRDTDIVGRYGGEEFAVILTETGIDPAVKVMNEVRRSFALLQHSSGEQDFCVTLSCGLASLAGNGDSTDLIATADKALYAAKTAGRNRVVRV